VVRWCGSRRGVAAYKAQVPVLRKVMDMERAKVRKSWAGRAGALVAALLFLTAFATPAARAEESRIDLNSASAAELESLPGVGPAKAQAIIAHREASPFKSAEELVDVKGIGEKLFAQLKDKVTVTAAPAARGKASGDAGGEAKGGRTASAGAH
jgi:competence ComEA-like helix-hairpin-helix protein